MFDIRNYLDKLGIEKEIHTQWTTRCPICSSKVQIQKSTGKYFCVGFCTAKDMRKAWGFFGGYTCNFAEAILNPIRPKVEEFTSIEVQPKLQVKEYFSEKHNQEMRITVFNYNTPFLILRMDFLGDKKKVFVPQVLENGQPKNIKETQHKASDFHFYQEDLLKIFNNNIFIVEGEKCAYTLSKELGVIALSPPGCGWNESWLRRNLKRLYYSVSNIYYLRDNDKVGEKKKDLFLKCCWLEGINAKEISLDKYYMFQGEDIGDLLESADHPIRDYILSRKIN
jgi:hypothetical protein